LSSQQPLGLTAAEVAERVARGEVNTYKAHVERSYWEITQDNVFNLFNIVLLLLVIILLVFRDYNSIVFASFSVIVNSLIGTVQEIRAKRALDRLAAMAVQNVMVWRDGKLVSVPPSQIVKDDVLLIEPGVRLVVDGRVLQSDSLEMDESLLTGESDPVEKEVGDPVCSGSFCIAGTGLIVATQVGAAATVNKLSKIAKAYRNVKTPTQLKVDTFVELAVAGMLIFGPMVVVAGYVQELPTLDTVRNALVLVTSFVPQGLVLVTTLSLTLGAITISRHQTLVQRINAVESLANVNVLCFDKTGTLTCNELAVTEILPLDSHTEDEIRSLLATYTANLAYLNKTAAAIASYLGTRSGDGAKQIAKQQEIPFSSARKWGAVVLADSTLILGAPERVIQRDRNDDAIKRAQKLAAEGLRVLAFACAERPPRDSKLDGSVDALALIVMSDRVRPDIQKTLQEFHEQNVGFKVISGDNLETVKAIATQAGIGVTRAYTGDQLESMSDAELESAVQQGNLFARIAPDTKRKIILALKRCGCYVAMVGDGVNDVPALKASDLAIAMNDGAQIAKDVADIVLLNNAMSTLPRAFAEGKVITQKIYGTARMFLSKNIYHIALFILASFMMLPFPINPIQISWVVFGAINIPSTLIAFGLLRPAYTKHFGRDVLTYVVVSGFVGALGMALFYAVVYLATDRKLDVARSGVMLFMTLYGVLVFLNTHGVDIFEVRTMRDHTRTTLLGTALGAFTIAAPFVLPHTFSFVPPTFPIWILLIAMFGVTAGILHVGLRNKYIVNSLKQLVMP
jgi:cation-transporting P-type ATPase E